MADKVVFQGGPYAGQTHVVLPEAMTAEHMDVPWEGGHYVRTAKGKYKWVPEQREHGL